MSMDEIFAICVGLFVTACFIAMSVKECREANRKAPYGKVFVKEFVEMVDDIHHAIYCCPLSCIDVSLHGYKFRVNVKAEIPYEGLEHEITPVYKSFAIYIDDEVVCRVHKILHSYKDRYFIEFSSKRNRSEVIEIVKEAHKLSRQYNHEYVTKLYSKYNSKSFYQDYSSSED